ncbi:MAG: hypothetical protein EHM28_08700 [Spirochaetaceae bacterium]|nr:MAG: hypothetical protein EHM28_08700 [Spirochaetaceae bacterium]
MPLVRAVSLKNSSEAARMEAELKNLEIPHAIRTLHDSAYDGLFQATGGYGFVEVDEADAPAVRDLYENLLKTQAPVKTENNDTRLHVPKEFKTIIGMILIVLLSVASIWFYTENLFLRHELNSYVNNENYYGGWNNEGTIYTRFWNRTNKIAEAHYDTDKDGLPDKIELYDQKGILVRELYDEYGQGIYSRQIDYYGKDKYLEWTSSDNSSRYDKLIIHNNGIQKTISVEDLFAK